MTDDNRTFSTAEVTGLLTGMQVKSGRGEGGGPVEEPQPEPRTTPPELQRPNVFPIKARLVSLQAFENDPAVVDSTLLTIQHEAGNDEITYSGRLVDTFNVTTGALESVGLATQVTVWLEQGEEKDMIDWELSVDPVTGYPRFLILWTE
jgi:hypothetical protein